MSLQPNKGALQNALFVSTQRLLPLFQLVCDRHAFFTERNDKYTFFLANCNVGNTLFAIFASPSIAARVNSGTVA